MNRGFRVPTPEFSTYCRVCYCGNEELHRERQGHEYQPKTTLKAHLFSGGVEVPYSIRQDYESGALAGQAVLGRFEACAARGNHRNSGIRELLPGRSYRFLCADCDCWVGSAGVEAH